MKKLLSIATCAFAVLAMSAQTSNLEQAKKMIGKADKIEEARQLLKDAMQNPETANSPTTYYLAGKLEWDAYDKSQAIQMVNPDKVNPVEMGKQLLNGYEYFMQVFPLDTLKDKKGAVKPLYTKELQKKIADKKNDFWNAAVVFYNEKMYYPEAYQAFMINGDIPGLEVLDKNRPIVEDTVRAVSYFNAGLSAWGSDQVEDASKAFRKAIENNYNDPQAYIYEIACWQNIEGKDAEHNREAEARENIYNAAKAGFEKFGMDQPLFLNNMINSLVNENKMEEALSLINDAIGKYPDKSNLFGLRAYIYDRLENEEASEADYRKAAEMSDIDYETMNNAVKKLIRIGQEKWNNIELGDPDSRSKKAAVKGNYFETAKKYAEKAKTLPGYQDGDMDYLIENIDYLLSL